MVGGVFLSSIAKAQDDKLGVPQVVVVEEEMRIVVGEITGVRRLGQVGVVLVIATFGRRTVGTREGERVGVVEIALGLQKRTLGRAEEAKKGGIAVDVSAMQYEKRIA